MSDLIKDAYLNPKKPSAFSSVEAVYKTVKPKVKGLTRDRVEEVLEDVTAFTQHRPNRTKFPRLITTASGIQNALQVDLADVSKHASVNNGVRYLLVCVDVYSRMFYVEPLKSKQGPEVAKAFEKIFKNFNSPPIYIYSDFGTEFYNSHVKKLFKSLNIRHYTPRSEIKCSMAERAIRTLKTRLAKYTTFKYATGKHGHTYIEALNDIVDGINNSVNRSTGMKPVDVQNGDIKMGSHKSVFKRSKFNVGDHVRISAKRQIFDKSYEQGWTEEVFVISVKYETNPETFDLVDKNGEPVEGKFYRYEITKCTYDKDALFRIEKYVGRRIYKGKKQVKVRWEGQPASFDEWVNEDEILDI